MKIVHLALLVTATNAFSVAPQNGRTATATSLNLFGGKKEGDDKKGPGFMDQMAMFKKAQEMASKKQKLDAELQQEVFTGQDADGKVTVSLQFVPVKNPMDPNPDYEASGFEFDNDWWEGASPEDISAAVTESLLAGITNCNTKVAEKYAVLQTDLMEALGQQGGEGAPPQE